MLLRRLIIATGMHGLNGYVPLGDAQIKCMCCCEHLGLYIPDHIVYMCVCSLLPCMKAVETHTLHLEPLNTGTL